MIPRDTHNCLVRSARRQTRGNASACFQRQAALDARRRNSASSRCPSGRGGDQAFAASAHSACLPPCQPFGLTLIELLVTIGILTMTVSLGAFFLKSQMPKLRLYAASSELAATLDRARRLAVSEQVPHGVKFSLADNQYVLMKLRPTALALATSTLTETINFYSTSTPFSDNTASFNSLGGAKEAGTIIIKNQSNETKTISIEPSGYVKVE